MRGTGLPGQPCWSSIRNKDFHRGPRLDELLGGMTDAASLSVLPGCYQSRQRALGRLGRAVGVWAQERIAYGNCPLPQQTQPLRRLYADLAIPGNQGQAAGQGLPHQHAVERVAVLGGSRQVGEPSRETRFQGQQVKSLA